MLDVEADPLGQEQEVPSGLGERKDMLLLHGLGVWLRRPSFHSKGHSQILQNCPRIRTGRSVEVQGSGHKTLLARDGPRF